MNDQLKQIIDELARIAPHAWEQMVRYAQVAAAMRCGSGLVLFVASYFLHKRAKAETDDFSRSGYLVGTIFAFVLGLVVISVNMPILINPEGSILASILAGTR